MPLTSSVVNQLITNFKLYCCSKKFQMLQKNVKSLLEQLKVCIFAEIVFGVRCTFTKICFTERFKTYLGSLLCQMSLGRVIKPLITSLLNQSLY